MKKKEDYSPYCKNCGSCGEDGCCSYIKCIINSIDNNKGCFYPETYKKELLVRDEFLNLCFQNNQRSLEIHKFLDEMLDLAEDNIELLFKKQIK